MAAVRRASAGQARSRRRAERREPVSRMEPPRLRSWNERSASARRDVVELWILVMWFPWLLFPCFRENIHIHELRNVNHASGKIHKREFLRAFP